MRDEWKAIVRSSFAESSRSSSSSSPGLTRNIGTEAGLDRSASLNLAARAMKMRGKGGQQSSLMNARQREVSARRQVGDAEDVVNSPARTGKDGRGGEEPWWKNVSMEEGM